MPPPGTLLPTVREEIMKATFTIRPSTKKLSLILSVVRDIDDTMPVQELACFLEVASRDGEMGIMELSGILNISTSSASRNISALSEWHYRKKQGLGLVQTVVDPMELRKKNVILTAKGKRLIEQINDILNSGEVRLAKT
jgi:DNA-binding MarR family transcriptional regulator